jgi:hypothetical protein
MDVRKNVGADIVADARFCPFRDGVFEKVYCDPPHYFKRDNPMSIAKIAHNRLMKGWLSPPAIIRYGFWTTKEKWLDFRERTCEEFWRILGPNGRLYYKITHGSAGSGLTRLEDLATYTFRFDLVGQRKRSRSTFGNPVFYLSFKRKGKAQYELPFITTARELPSEVLI